MFIKLPYIAISILVLIFLQSSKKGLGNMGITFRYSLLKAVWYGLKTWRKLPLGPLSLTYKFERTVRVTRNRSRRANTGRRDADLVGAAEHTARGDEYQSRPNRGAAVIVGVGPGFGYAMARRLADDGFDVVLVSRNAERLDELVQQIASNGGSAFRYGCDATMETSVTALFDLVKANHGVPALVIYSIQNFGPGNVVDIELAAFEDGWKHNCLGSFLVARTAARAMLTRSSGTIVLIGSTSAILGRSGHLNLAVGKFGQRALAQVLARELWPRGIHVAHVVIDADITDDETPIDQEPHAEPADIAEIVLNLHNQPKSAWTSEIDVRPWNEKFWQHC
jgi:NAD(P)-dependent dehydrogenase (short-subunit alcohol dehydrogenase family)